MKKQTKGKRFTKVEYADFSGMSPQEVLEQLSGQPFPSIMDKIAGARQVAENILTDQGLPTEPKTSWTGIDGREWHGYLDKYVSELYPKDSPEDLAARIIVTCHRLSNATGDKVTELAYQVGQLAAYARVYQMIDRDSAKGGNRSKRKPWGDALAKKLCHLSDDEIYWALADDESDIQVKTEGWRFDILFKEDPETLTHDVIQAIPFDDLDTPQASQTMRLSTFLKHYIRPARKKPEKI